MLQTKPNQPSGIQPGQETPVDFESLFKQLKDISIENGNIVRSMVSAFETMEAQASKIRQIFGGTKLLVDSFKDSINDAIPSVTFLGGKMEDSAKIQ
jgi:hypothetical protein